MTVRLAVLTWRIFVVCKVPDGYERLKIMGMFDPKKRKLVTAIIAVILVLAMVVPAVLSLLL